MPLTAGNAHYAALQQADEQRKPISAFVELTHACNVDCEHCYLELVPDKKIGALSTEEWKRVFRELKAAGTLFLTLSGGEILVRRDWFELATYARSLGFALTLFTNGTLVDEVAAERIAGLRPLRVEISLLGGIAATHDAIARRRGAFDRTIAGVRHLRAKGVKVLLKCVVMKRNAAEVAEIERIAAELGCRVQLDISVTPKNDGSNAPRALVADDDALTRAARRIDELAGVSANATPPLTDRAQRLDAHPCAAGRRTCHVGPTGALKPCLQWQEPVGNLREASFQSLWENNAALEKIRAVRVRDFPHCARCDLLAVCSPCMALSALERGARGGDGRADGSIAGGIDGPSTTKCTWAEARARSHGIAGRSAWLLEREGSREPSSESSPESSPGFAQPKHDPHKRRLHLWDVASAPIALEAASSSSLASEPK